MQQLKFCPKCGKETLIWDGEKKWNCSNCDFVLYNNVAGAVAVIIKYNDELFFTKRNREPQKRKLDLAGGFVDPRESAEDTCKRELYEELRLQIEVTKLKYLASLPNVYHYKGIDYNTIDLFYEYSVEEKFDTLLQISEISEINWIKKSEVNLDDLAFDSQKKFLKTYLNH